MTKRLVSSGRDPFGLTVETDAGHFVTRGEVRAKDFRELLELLVLANY